jgi:hypothetical protein
MSIKVRGGGEGRNPTFAMSYGRLRVGAKMLSVISALVEVVEEELN